MKVSLIVPTFNRADKLRQAIECIIAQTHTNWEMIIVDDGSVDDTAMMVQDYSIADSRIKYFRNTGKGVSSARNFGVRQCNGDYIAFLDDDDISLPHRFESQLNAIKKSGREFVVSGIEVRERETNKLLKRNADPLVGFGAGFPSRWMMSRSLWDKAGGYDEKMTIMEDPEFSYRVAQYETFAMHAEVVTIMYRTEGSLSSSYYNVHGRFQLLRKVQHLMPGEESGWWYYVNGVQSYVYQRNYRAQLFFINAVSCSGSIAYRYACFHFYLTGKIRNSLFRRANIKFLSWLGGVFFPKLVSHPVVSDVSNS